MSIFALLPAFAGCGPKISNANIEAVNQEYKESETRGGFVSPKALESILGQPTRVETFVIPLETRKPTLTGLRYYYEQEGKTIEYHFVDDKLINTASPWDAPQEPRTVTKQQ